jgi:glutamine synthetase
MPSQHILRILRKQVQALTQKCLRERIIHTPENMQTVVAALEQSAPRSVQCQTFTKQIIREFVTNITQELELPQRVVHKYKHDLISHRSFLIHMDKDEVKSV